MTDNPEESTAPELALFGLPSETYFDVPNSEIFLSSLSVGADRMRNAILDISGETPMEVIEALRTEHWSVAEAAIEIGAVAQYNLAIRVGHARYIAGDLVPTTVDANDPIQIGLGAAASGQQPQQYFRDASLTSFLKGTGMMIIDPLEHRVFTIEI